MLESIFLSWVYPLLLLIGEKIVMRISRW